MSTVVLDDHLSSTDVFAPVARWTTVRFLRDLRPPEVIKDERVPMVLRMLRQPTFVTLDDWFWDRRRQDARYCIVYVALRENEQQDVPVLLRSLFRHSEFRTKALRMGKVVRVSRDRIAWWQIGAERQHTSDWTNRIG